MERTQGRNEKLTGFAHELGKKKRAEDPWVDHGSTLTCKTHEKRRRFTFPKSFRSSRVRTLQENNHRLPEDDALPAARGGERKRKKDVEAEGALLVRLTLCSRGTSAEWPHVTVQCRSEFASLPSPSGDVYTRPRR